MASAWAPSNQYKRVAEANRRSYERSASLYDKTETCVVSGRLQSMLQNDLDAILSMIQEDSGRQVRALDACGGSGNAALKLLIRGVDVTLCDISPELIRLFESKCKEKGIARYTAVCQEIGSFLSSTKLKFDLIVFSSALHHIEDYTSVLKMAASHLNNNGFIYTVFDPIKWKFPTYQIIWVDWLFFAALKYPSELFSAANRKLSRKVRRPKNGHVSTTENLRSTDLDLDTLTEYHVRQGIDDFALVNALEETGLKIVRHDRYSDARHAPFRLLLSMLKQPTNFKLLLSAP